MQHIAYIEAYPHRTVDIHELPQILSSYEWNGTDLAYLDFAELTVSTPLPGQPTPLELFAHTLTDHRIIYDWSGVTEQESRKVTGIQAFDHYSCRQT